MALIDKPTQLGQTKAWHGSIGTYNVYTYGVAGERFFRTLKEKGKFLGTRCTSCQLTYAPPRIYCERCFSALEEWMEVPSRGTVQTYTVAYLGLSEQPLSRPEVFAVINLEGCHGGMLHRLGEVEPEEVHIGMRVEARLKTLAERKGAITDIRYFRPAK